MLSRLSKHVSFANAVAVIALFVVLGGAAYAGSKINGKTIKNNSIPAKKLKKGVLTNPGQVSGGRSEQGRGHLLRGRLIAHELGRGQSGGLSAAEAAGTHDR
jgi:hypothetical protein